MTEKQLLAKTKTLFNLCLRINETTKHDAFFGLSPHVSQTKVIVYEWGWNEWNMIRKEEGEDKADEARKRLSFYYKGDLTIGQDKVNNFIKYMKGLLV